MLELNKLFENVSKIDFIFEDDVKFDKFEKVIKKIKEFFRDSTLLEDNPTFKNVNFKFQNKYLLNISSTIIKNDLFGNLTIKNIGYQSLN